MYNHVPPYEQLAEGHSPNPSTNTGISENIYSSLFVTPLPSVAICCLTSVSERTSHTPSVMLSSLPGEQAIQFSSIT